MDYSRINLIKMSEAISFEEMPDNTYICDCTDLEGTKCYLDESSEIELTKRLDNIPLDSIHFIDSGNYHYLSLMFVRRIDEPFYLVQIDHHPDSQLPAFGDITSCGGWVAKALAEKRNIKAVYMYGISKDLYSEVKENCYVEQPLPNDQTPVYISIDKDALSTDYAITDWDQGQMKLEELLQTLETIIKNHPVLGIDICGDTSTADAKSIVINTNTNSVLLDFFSNFH